MTTMNDVAADRQVSAPIRLFTIGFTQKSARQFFSTLIAANVRRVVDVRLNNVSQLAAFAKRADLEYFLSALGNIGYIHAPQLAPTQDILDSYKKRKGAWADYERQFLALMSERRIEQSIALATLDNACLLCSEPTPEHCHRRLVAEYLREKLGGIEICHL
jgi:uncharacterized protein (DUF488 family)